MNEVKFIIDLGSTFTKVVVVDFKSDEILCCTRAPSTVNVDVMIGLREAIEKAKKAIGIKQVNREDMLACSSAAGGLKMVCVGLVPTLSLKAGNLAALGAGAKLLKTYSHELTSNEVAEIENILPDIILLVGGTDGGNKSVVLHNAKMLSSARTKAVIVVACNKATQNESKTILEGAGKKVRLAKNVMPEIRKLEVDSCREVIRRVFVNNIVKAKGMGKVKEMIKEVIMPTPTAVLNATKIIAEGVDGEAGVGELMVVDVGGATTDVHSVARGDPVEGVNYQDLLPEPYAKRTVEGDIGIRYNMETLLKLGKRKKLLTEDDMKIANSFSNSNKVPENEDEALVDMKLARVATEVAVERHVGKIETWYGPTGKNLMQKGKDLRSLSSIIGTGGPIIFARDPKMVLKGALFNKDNPNLLKPRSPKFFIDDHYILYAVGVLATLEPKKALRIAKKFIMKL
jgi:uncharacterized protein (TIGR01319 family)